MRKKEKIKKMIRKNAKKQDIKWKRERIWENGDLERLIA